MIIESKFASMSSRNFVEYLESHGISPTQQEQVARPVGSVVMESGITLSILETKGQRNGDPEGDYSAK